MLLKAGFDVKFVTGTKRDLVTPDGQKIRMIFGDNLLSTIWRLPMWSDPVRYATQMIKRLLPKEIL